jgi:hypothetical protein
LHVCLASKVVRQESRSQCGWGCTDNHVDKKALAIQIAELEVDSSWRPSEVIAYIAKLVKEL